MEQHTPTPVRLRQLLAAVLAAAALIWLMTGLFAPLTLGILIAVLLSPAAESLCRRTGCSRRVAAVGVVFLFYLLLGLVLAAGLIWAANRGTPTASPALELSFGASAATAGVPFFIASSSGDLGDCHLGTHPFRMDFPDLRTGGSTGSPLDQPLACAAAGQRLYCTAQFLCRRRLSPALLSAPAANFPGEDRRLKKTPSLCRTGAAADAPDLGDPFSDAAGDSDCGPVAAPGAPPPVCRRAHHPV